MPSPRDVEMRGPGVQVPPQLHRELEARLSYTVSPYLKSGRGEENGSFESVHPEHLERTASAQKGCPLRSRADGLYAV